MFISLLNINDFVLTALIGAVLFFDLTRKKIPNILTFPTIIYGIISNTVMQGFEGLWFSFLGLLVGLAIFFIPFAMGAMGGGDIKLLGAVGAIQGWQFVLSAAILTILAGGVMALIYLIIKGNLVMVLKKIFGFILIPLFSALYYYFRLEFFNRFSVFFTTKNHEDLKAGRIPYGAAIAVGVMALLAMNFFQWGESFHCCLPL